MNRIISGTSTIEGKILIGSIKALLEINIKDIYNALVEFNTLKSNKEIILYVLNDEDDKNSGYTEVIITVLDDRKICIILDNEKSQQQVILDTSSHTLNYVPDDQSIYNIITKSSILIFKCIYKSKDIDGHIYNYVLGIDPTTENGIKMRCLSFILDANVEKLLANEIAMEGEYDLRKFIHIEPNKTAVLLYDPTKNRMCIDIQLYDERETFIFTFKDENIDISVNTLASLVVNAVISDYLSEQFGFIYTSDDRLE